MDLGSLGFAAVFLGGLALCYFAMKVRFKQISYECELVFEVSPEMLDALRPAVGDMVYYFSQINARRSPLGTTHTMQSSVGGAWAMGERLFVQNVLGVVSAINGPYIYVETFGFEGKGVWFVVDSNSVATGAGKVNSVMNLAFRTYDQVHFTIAETGSGNAVLRGMRRI